MRPSKRPKVVTIGRTGWRAGAIVAAIAAVILSSCVQYLVPQEDVDFAKRIVSLLQAGDIEAVEAAITPATRSADPHIRAKIQKMAAVVPRGNPASVSITGWRRNYNNSLRSDVLGLEYGFGDRWLFASFVIERIDGELRATSVNLTLNQQSLLEANALLRGKSFFSYLFVSMWVGLFVLMVYALVKCFRTPRLQRKWLWCLFIATGFGHVSLNWTTQTLSFQLLFVLIPVASFSGGGYAPIFFTMTLPLGALMFLNRRAGEPSEPGDGAEANPAPPSQNA